LRLALLYQRRGFQRLRAERRRGRKRRERGIGDGADQLVHTDLASEARLRGGQVGLCLEQREPSIAKVDPGGQRVGAGGRARLELVDGDLELFFGTVQLRLRHAHELFIGEGREKGFRRRGGYDVPLVYDASVGRVLGGGRRALGRDALKAIEQVEGQTQRARIGRVRGRDDDLSR